MTAEMLHYCIKLLPLLSANNGTKYDIKSYDLRRVLSGQTINLQSDENLKSNSKYKFEIKF